MSYILHIDTSSEKAHVSIAADGKIIAAAVNDLPQDHASFLHPAIERIVKESNIVLKDLSAVAVVNGPGSYTGLRIGMAAAKGICYALNKPLITLNALDIMAAAAIEGNEGSEKKTLFFPMLDARRMEIFTAGYTYQHELVFPYAAIVLNENSFSEELKKSKILFFGRGAAKWKKICNHPNAIFNSVAIPASIYGQLSQTVFQSEKFAELAYAVPFYIKEVYIANSNNI